MTDHELKIPVDERLDPTVERAATLLRRPEPVRQALGYEGVQIPAQPWRHIFEI